MDRITEKCWRNLDPWECCGQDLYCKRKLNEDGGCIKGCRVPLIYKRLACYEDLDEQGLLVKSVCKVGDTVWIIDKELDTYEGYKFMANCGDYVLVATEYAHCVGNFQRQLDEMSEESYDNFGVSIEIFPKDTMFLTEEDARQELKTDTERIECNVES